MQSPTASLAHVCHSEWSKVYEPAEDSWLLSDAICGDYPAWGGCGGVILELGSGSGAVCTSVLLYLRGLRGGSHGSMGGGDGAILARTQPPQPAALTIACDLSPHACRVTAATGEANGVSSHLDVVQCDLLSPLVSRMSGAVDLFIFNPPYVPTPREEVPDPSAFAGDTPLEDTLPAAWAGGEDGRQVIDRALPLLPKLLRQPGVGAGAGEEEDGGGVAYWLLLKENDPKGIIAAVGDLGLQGKVVAHRTAANEKLCVVRFEWKKRSSTRATE